MSSPGHKHYALADLEWMLVPAVLSNQFSIAEARNRDSGPLRPVAAVLWAKVSEETDERLCSDLDRPLRLRPDEWASGDIVWIIDAIGPAKIVNSTVDRMRETVFADRPVKTRALGKDGKRMIRTLEAKAANKAGLSAR